MALKQVIVITNSPNIAARCRPMARRTTCLVYASLQYKTIGRSDLHVSSICLGTMLFGESTSASAAHTLLSTAADSGINFFDSAEMYPVPQRSETQGASERILGDWLKTQRRSDFVVATKIAGPGGMTWLRGGPVALDAANITQAIEASLDRLQIDYLDLCQLHWPDRYVPMFGDVDFDPSCCYASCPIEEQLEALSKAVEQGKVRYIGLSNETPYGLMSFCQLAPSTMPIVSLQNAYSLTCRTFDSGLAECCYELGVSLMAYSPLAMGLLTGKYLEPGGGPPDARLNKYKGRYAEAESRYGPKPNVRQAVTEYVALAHTWGITPVELALGFVLNHPLVCSAVTGATSLGQLEELINAASKADGGLLNDELREAIDNIHVKYPNPTP